MNYSYLKTNFGLKLNAKLIVRKVHIDSLYFVQIFFLYFTLVVPAFFCIVQIN